MTYRIDHKYKKIERGTLPISLCQGIQIMFINIMESQITHSSKRSLRNTAFNLIIYTKKGSERQAQN